jgi:hypothetical protein
MWNELGASGDSPGEPAKLERESGGGDVGRRRRAVAAAAMAVERRRSIPKPSHSHLPRPLGRKRRDPCCPRELAGRCAADGGAAGG